jgi:Spy/CpxP family protein refolding chaperone
MQQSKNLAIAFLLGAVLVGGALGFAADRVMLGDRIARNETGRLKLADRLQLDAAQRARLDSIIDDRHRRWQLVMAPVQPALDSIKLRARDEIRLMLTPTQRAEFEKVLAEMSDTNKTRDDDN